MFIQRDGMRVWATVTVDWYATTKELMLQFHFQLYDYNRLLNTSTDEEKLELVA